MAREEPWAAKDAEAGCRERQGPPTSSSPPALTLALDLILSLGLQ